MFDTIDTSQLICFESQLAGFNIIPALIFNGSIYDTVSIVHFESTYSCNSLCISCARLTKANFYFLEVNYKQNVFSQIEETTASRRSSRARKPKQFEDSICYTGKRKSSVNEENKAKTPETTQGKY